MNALFMGIALTEREVAALAALDKATVPLRGDGVARRMQAAGRPTTVQAAHQAGAALARKGLAIKAQQHVDLRVCYEINNLGREWITQYQRMGGTP